MNYRKSFREWCIDNNEIGLLNMFELAENDIQADDIGFSSTKIVNWKCPTCNMVWSKTLNSITSKNKFKGCRYCAKKEVSYFYNLKTEFPELAQQWDKENNSKHPEDIICPLAKKKYFGCVIKAINGLL